MNENKIFNQRARCKEKYSIEIYDRWVICALGRKETSVLQKKNQHEGKFNGTAEKKKKTEVKEVLHSLVDTCETLDEGEF